jgi:hypothetical protein
MHVKFTPFGAALPLKSDLPWRVNGSVAVECGAARFGAQDRFPLSRSIVSSRMPWSSSGLDGRRLWGPEIYADSLWINHSRPLAVWRPFQNKSAKIRPDRVATVAQPTIFRACDMIRTWTLSACFEHFGAACPSRHFHGSAISKDGQTVVVALWDDEIERNDDRIIYRSEYHSFRKTKNARVSSKWIASLKWASAHCDGVVHVVILKDKDGMAKPRTIMSCYPDDSLLMKIKYFDSQTGAILAESV